MKVESSHFCRLVGFLAVIGSSFAGLLAVPAVADTTLTYGRLQDDGKTIEAQRIRVQGTRLSIDGGKDEPHMIYYSKYQRAYLVDHVNKSFFRLDLDKVGEVVDALAAARVQALEEMDARLKTVPKEDRAELERMIAKLQEETVKMENAPEHNVEFAPTGETVELGGHETEVVQSTINGKAASTYFLADREAVGVAEEDFALIQKFVEFLKDVQIELPPSLRSHFGTLDMLAAPGGKLPLKVVSADGLPEVLLDVSSEAFDRKLMNVPPNYVPSQLPNSVAQ